MNNTKKSVALAITGAFALSVVATSVNAVENPFSATSLASGYQVADNHDTKAKEGKCAIGKCGANKKKMVKGAEGKCSAEKAKEGKCSTEMNAVEGKAKEGKCSAEKAKEGKCSAEKAK